MLALSFALCAFAQIAWAETPLQYQGPLAEYVRRPDASYAWKKRREGQAGLGRYVELTLTSQTWKDTVWKHQLFLLKPAAVAPGNKHAVLFIAGGSWKPELEAPPAPGEKLPKEAELFSLLAEQFHTPVAVLMQVPEQPILGGKKEDAAIAYTFQQFLKTGDEDWPLLLPMVKSAVRAMDAVQEAADKEWNAKLETFTVSGASKRGWTTWLTGAVETRATALAPMVIDVLNMNAQLKLQRETWGDLSEEISDYKEQGIDRQSETPRGKALNKMVDPYQYRERYTQPKLILLGTNDRYWPVDALNLYWDDLPGEKYVLYVPNNGHGLKDYPRLFGAMQALNDRARLGTKMPKLDWKFTESGEQLQLVITSDIKPLKVDAWTASTPTKDFRDSTWTSRPAESRGAGYHAALPRPAKGHAALFAELTFESEVPGGYQLSTQLHIIGAKVEAKP
jgi:PhoPQ-activated pathogenicity-related protein